MQTDELRPIGWVRSPLADRGAAPKQGDEGAPPARPRRPPSTRRAVADTRLAEIVQVAATTGDDPALDALILRLHIETACRRGGALALRPVDLDHDQWLIALREKGDTTRSQPVSPTLMSIGQHLPWVAAQGSARTGCATPP